MPDEPKLWEVEEARSYLPRIRELLAVLRRAAEARAGAAGNGHWSRSQSSDKVTVDQALDELSRGSVILRDLEQGLIDFPSQSPRGRVVLLCWRSEEEDLSWWHSPEEGFAGRRPLPVPPDV